MTNPIYTPPARISAFVPQTLAAAYAAAGINRPAPPEERIEKALRALPDAGAVARTLIGEAHDTEPSPAKFMADARRRLTEASAHDVLREQWSRHGSTATAARLPKVTDQAAKDLAPAFADTVKALREAAEGLSPRDTPENTTSTPSYSGAPGPSSEQGTPGSISLDAEVAIARDAGAALTTARRELARLAVFAGISAAVPLPDIVAAGLAPLVPVLAVEGAVIEQCIRSVGQDVRNTNESELRTTRALRRLAADARNDIDATILGVVHGNYEGVSLRLNSTEQCMATRQQIVKAFERAWIDDPRPNHGGQFMALL